jgi:hypothetical protein
VTADADSYSDPPERTVHLAFGAATAPRAAADSPNRPARVSSDAAAEAEAEEEVEVFTEEEAMLREHRLKEGKEEAAAAVGGDGR